MVILVIRVANVMINTKLKIRITMIGTEKTITTTILTKS